MFSLSEDLILNRIIQYEEVKLTLFKKFRDKIALSGVTVLCIGVSLLIFTFFSAYGFLMTDLSPVSTQDLVQTFGEALGPLIAAAIHIMYLGVMGWISSLITIRGVTILTHIPRPPQNPQQHLKQKPQPEAQNTISTSNKNETHKAKSSEPELMVIPLEEMEQQPRTQKKPKRKS